MPRNTIFLNLQRSQQARTHVDESHPLPVLHSHPQSLPTHLQLSLLPPRVYPLETPTLTLGTVLLPWSFHPWIPRLVSLQWTCRRLYSHHISSSLGTLSLGVDRIPSQPFLLARLYPSLLLTNLKKHSLPGNPWPPCFSKIQWEQTKEQNTHSPKTRPGTNS